MQSTIYDFRREIHILYVERTSRRENLKWVCVCGGWGGGSEKETTLFYVATVSCAAFACAQFPRSCGCVQPERCGLRDQLEFTPMMARTMTEQLFNMALKELTVKEPYGGAEDGGYDLDFTDDTISDRYNCQICTKILREPHLTVCCGKHFCDSCLKTWFKKKLRESCPHCRAEGRDFNHVINKGLRSEINQLKVECSNRSKGCEWSGELGDLTQHGKGCDYAVVECPKKCRPRGFYTTELLRKDVEQHLKTECFLRPYKCKYCGLEDTYKNITGEGNFLVTGIGAHYEKCPNFPVLCPNKCGVEDTKRKDIEIHCGVCPQEPIACPFAEAGCKSNLLRYQLSSHLKSDQQQHLMLMMGAYKQMKEKLCDTEARLTTAIGLLSQQNVNVTEKAMINAIIGPSNYLIKSGDSVEMTISKFSEYCRMRKVWHSRPFYFKDGYKMCLAVGVKDMMFGVCSTITVKICLMVGEHDDRLKWPVVCPITEQGGMHLPPPCLGSIQPCTYFKVCSMEQLHTTNQEVMSCTRFGKSVLNDCISFKVEFATNCFLKVSIV